jgi:class 3 adenylate cyclase
LISFGIGASVFIISFIILFGVTPFSLKKEILTRKLLLLDLSMQNISSNEKVLSYLVGRKAVKESFVDKGYHALLNNSFHGVIEFSENLVIDYANPLVCKLFETPHSIFIGSHLKTIFEKNILKAFLTFVSSNSDYFSIECQAVKPNRSLFKVVLTVIRVHQQDLLSSFVCFIQDVSLIQNQEKLLKSEKEKSEKLLLNILPKQIAETKLLDKNATVVDVYQNCTILFSDMVNFTSKSSELNPDEIVSFLNEIFEGFDDICERFNVEKIKTIGDCYMAVTGVPNRSEDHAQQMMEFAIELHNLVDKYNVKHKSDIQFRTGMNSGKVVAGVIGKRKFCFDLWGNTVNIASRMESTGVASQIQISQSTYDLLKDEFEFEERGEINVKGIGLMKTFLFKTKKELELESEELSDEMISPKIHIKVEPVENVKIESKIEEVKIESKIEEISEEIIVE